MGRRIEDRTKKTDNLLISELKITSTLQGISKYLYDMKVLCIQIISMLNTIQQKYQQNQHLSHTRKTSLQQNVMINNIKKTVGYAYISLRKYFVSHRIDCFQEKAVIYDQNKNKIGEAVVGFKIQMIQNNGLRFKQYIQQIQLEKCKNNSKNGSKQLQNNHVGFSQSQFNPKYSKKVSINDTPKISYLQINQTIGIHSNKYHHQNQLLHENKLKKIAFTEKQIQQKYNNIKSQNIILKNNQQQKSNKRLNEYKDQEQQQNDQQNQQSYRVSLNLNNKRSTKQLNQINNINKRLQKSNSYSQLIPPRPQHTDLSLIRMKYGYNHPSIQLMQLKYDQARYLFNQANNNNNNQQLDSLINGSQQAKQIKLYLDQLIFVISKPTQAFLSNSSVNILHLNQHNNIISKNQLSLLLLLQQNMDKSKNVFKFNSYVVLFNNFNVQKDKIVIQIAQANSNQITFKQLASKNVVQLRKKQNNIRKRVYQIQYKLQIVENKEKQIINIKEEQKNKQPSKQNKTKRTKQIQKIINNTNNKSPKSKIQNLLIPENEQGQKAPKIQQLSYLHQKQHIQSSQIYDKQQLLKKLIQIYQRLYNCQDIQCFQIIQKLISLEEKQKLSMNGSSKQIKKLHKKMLELLKIDYKEQQNILEIILLNLFNNCFVLFYQSFMTFKSINLRFQTILNKLTKILTEDTSIQQQEQIYIENNQNQYHSKHNGFIILKAIINYIKKHKKQKINFGLISYNDFLMIFKQKYRQIYENYQHKKSLYNVNMNQIIKSNESNTFNKNQQEQFFKYLKAFLNLFVRYQNQYIKLTELQEFIDLIMTKNRIHQQNQQENQNKKKLQDKINLNYGLIKRLTEQTQQIVIKQKLNSIESLNVSGVQIEQIKKQFYKDHQLNHLKFIQSYFYTLFNKNHQDRNKQHESITNNKLPIQPTLFSLLFSDPLQLQNMIQSSIHLSQFDQNNNKFLSQKQYHIKQKNRIYTQSQAIISNSQYKQHIYTQQAQNRLNTQDQNNQGEEEISIEVTKRQIIKEIPKQIYQQNKQIQKRKQNQLQIYNNIPKSKHISIKIRVLQHDKQKNNRFSYKNNEQESKYRIYYMNKTNPQTKQIKLKLCNQQNKNNRNYLINQFSNSLSRQKQHQILTLKIQKISNTILNKTNSYSIIQNQSQQDFTQTFIKIPAILGVQSYPIEHPITKIVENMLQIQIDQVQEQDYFNYQDRLQQSKLQQERKIDKYLNKSTKIIIFNIKKLISLSKFYQENNQQQQEKQVSYRLIHQIQGKQQINVRDYTPNQQNYSKFKKIRVVQFQSIQSIKLQYQNQKQNKNRKKYSTANQLQNQKHFIKIFKFSKQDKKHKITSYLTNKTNHKINRKIDPRQKLQLLCQFQFIINNKNNNQLALKLKQQQQNQNYQQPQQQPIPSTYIIFPHHHNLLQKSTYHQTIFLIDHNNRLQLQIFCVQYQKGEQFNNQQQLISFRQEYKLNKNVLEQQKQQKQNIWKVKIFKIIQVFFNHNIQKISNKIINTIVKQQKEINKINTYEQYLDRIFIIISQFMMFRMTEKEIFKNILFKNLKQQKQSNQSNQYHHELINMLKVIQLLKLFNININYQNKIYKKQLNLIKINEFINIIRQSIVKKCNKNIGQKTSLLSLYEQFQTFDLQQWGLLTQLKCQVVKRCVKQLKQLELQKYILPNENRSIKNKQNQQITQEQHYKQQNQPCIIIDNKIDKYVKNNKNIKIIDYVKILWDLRLNQNIKDDFFITQQNEQFNQINNNKMKIQKYDHQQQNKQINKPHKPMKQRIQHINPKYNNSRLFGLLGYRLSIKKFEQLHLIDSQNPLTLQFNINKNMIFQPIYRCYTHSFTYPYPNVLIVFNQYKNMTNNKINMNKFDLQQQQQYSQQQLTLSISSRQMSLSKNKQLSLHQFSQKGHLTQHKNKLSLYESTKIQQIKLLPFIIQSYEQYKQSINKNMLRYKNFIIKQQLNQMKGKIYIEIQCYTKVDQVKSIQKVLQNQLHQDIQLQQQQQSNQQQHQSPINNTKDQISNLNIHSLTRNRLNLNQTNRSIINNQLNSTIIKEQIHQKQLQQKFSKFNQFHQLSDSSDSSDQNDN